MAALTGNRPLAGSGAARRRLLRPPVRRLRAAPRRRPCPAARRGHRSGPASAGKCSSRAPARRPTRAWATAARCCARRSASSSRSEAMHGLGIPTTRALAVTGSDFPVIRERVETAAVVTRLAPSFVRFGTFEYFYWTRAARRAAPAGRLRHRPLLSGVPRRAPALPGTARASVAPHGTPGGAVAGRRLLPRRAEHRQHVDPRPDDRLRPVRLHRRASMPAMSATTATSTAATPTTCSRRSGTGTSMRWARRWSR